MEELLLKYIQGDCTDQEKISIIEWLDANPENMKQYMALRKLNDFSIWQTSESQNRGVSQVGVNRKGLRRIFPVILKIAAVFIFALLVARIFFPGIIVGNHDVAMQTLYVPAGQRAEMTLSDGTKVWLNAKTTLIFPTCFKENRREVKLDGEGFFEVTADKKRPFIVNTKKYNIRVWGTKFNLTAYSDSKSFETSLLEGVVEVMPQNGTTGLMLKPNEQVSLKNGKMVVSPINNPDYFLWKDGIISFDNISFIELINRLEFYFDVKIEIRNDQVLKSCYTGKFRMKDGIEHILRVLQLKSKFDYQIDNKLNKIIIE